MFSKVMTYPFLYSGVQVFREVYCEEDCQEQETSY